MKKYENVPLESQVPQYERWARCLQNGQVGNVFFLPYIGLVYRIEQFSAWVKGAKVVDLQNLDGEGIDLIGELPKTGKVIVMMRGVLLSPDGIRIAREIEKWLVSYEGGVVFVHELAPVALNIRNDWPTWVHIKQMVYQMVEPELVQKYIDNVSNEMKIKVEAQDIEQIIQYCGGWLWLVKDLLRTKAENPILKISELVKSMVFEQKMKLLWESWPEAYHQAILGTKKDQKVIEEMKEIGIFDENGKVEGNKLADFIARQKVERIKVSDDTVEFDGRDYTDKLTEGDRKVLAKLWESKELLPRTEVAKLFWGDDYGYEASDWAIDQKMRRLRNKLAKLGLPIVIVTKKGEGYGIAR